MNELIEEYLGSALNGEVTMGQQLLLGGAALLVFSILLSVIFAVTKVKYNPDKARKKAASDSIEQTAPTTVGMADTMQRSAVVRPAAQTPVQDGAVIQPKKQEQMTQNGTTILPKKQEQVTQNGTTILPKKQEQMTQNGTTILPKKQEQSVPQYTEQGTLILPKQGQK